MRNLYLLIILLLVFSCGSSKDWFVPKADEWTDVHYEDGLKFLQKGNLDLALRAFHSTQLFDSVSSKSIKSTKIIDSLLPIFRQNKTKKLNGRWKLKELNFDPYPGSFSDIIEFTDSLVIFYSYNSNLKLKIDRKERINYEKYDPSDILFNPYRLEFKNNEIWIFEIEKKLFKNKLYPTIEKGSDGYYHSILDERSIIIDKRARRKALREELYTFYEREK